MFCVILQEMNVSLCDVPKVESVSVCALWLCVTVCAWACTCMHSWCFMLHYHMHIVHFAQHTPTSTASRFLINKTRLCVPCRVQLHLLIATFKCCFLRLMTLYLEWLQRCENVTAINISLYGWCTYLLSYTFIIIHLTVHHTLIIIYLFGIFRKLMSFMQLCHLSALDVSCWEIFSLFLVQCTNSFSIYTQIITKPTVLRPSSLLLLTQLSNGR